MLSTTGERIRQARKAANMTQRELAEKIGVQFSAVHKYETGMIVNLKRETISALASVLNVRPSWLMCIDDEEGPITVQITDEESRLLQLYRLADQIDRQTIWNILSRYDEERSLSQNSVG